MAKVVRTNKQSVEKKDPRAIITGKRVSKVSPRVASVMEENPHEYLLRTNYSDDVLGLLLLTGASLTLPIGKFPKDTLTAVIHPLWYRLLALLVDKEAQTSIRSNEPHEVIDMVALNDLFVEAKMYRDRGANKRMWVVATRNSPWPRLSIEVASVNATGHDRWMLV